MAHHKVSKAVPQKRRWHERHRRWRRAALLISGLLLLATLGLAMKQARRAGAAPVEPATVPTVKRAAAKPAEAAGENTPAVPDPAARNGADQSLLVD